MAEDTTPTDAGSPATPEGDGNGAPARIDRTAEIAAARQAALDAGFQVLDPAEMHGVKEKAAEKAIKEAADLAAQLEAERAEKAELARWKAEQDNKGKSEMELLQERQRAWEADAAEKQSAIDAAQAEKQALSEQLEAERIQNQIRGRLKGVTPGAEEAAMDWMMKKVGPMLSTNDDRALVWTDPRGVPHEGAAALNLVDEVWAEQKFFHTSPPPGPPTAGAPAAPTQPTSKKPDKLPGETRIDYLMRLEQWQAKQQR